jgi:hypothetical protein
MKFSQMVESKFLKKEDVDGDMTVTIQKFGQMNVAPEDKPEEKKWAVKFKEFNKPMILNSTNIQMMQLATGCDDANEAVGKQVCLYVDHSIMYAGKIMGGLRIKPVSRTQPSVGATGGFDDLTDDVPF